MIRRSLVIALLSLSCVASARADDPLIPLLVGAPDPVSVRHVMLDAAAAAAPADSLVAARAWYLAGLSYQRSGAADSAIVCWQQAVERHADGAAMDHLIEAWYARAAAGDVERGRALVTRRLRIMDSDAEEFDQPNAQGRLAWGLFLAGRADSAHKTFQRVRFLLDTRNPMAWIWRRRIGLASQAAGDHDRALEMSKDLVVRSWMQDHDALVQLHDALGGSDSYDKQYAPFLRTDLLHAQQDEQADLEALHARRVVTTGADGFPLNAVLFDPPPHARRLVLAIASHDGEYAEFDSLEVGLARAGYAIAVMDPRGSGHSVSRDCPTPESRVGREETIESATAADVRPMALAVAREAKLDSTGYIVLGSLGSSASAAEAASVDRHVKGLVLLTPEPALVELGRIAARLHAAHVPTFFSTAVSEPIAAEVSDRLYEVVDPMTSRLLDSSPTGRGPLVFRYESGAAARLARWLAERFNVPSASRPASRRTGSTPHRSTTSH